VLLTALTAGFVEQIDGNPALPKRVQAQLTEAANASGLDVVPVAEVEQSARDAGLGPRKAAAVATSYGDALLDALKRALGAVAFLALIGLWFTKGLPGRTQQAPAPEPGANAPAPAKREAAAAGGSAS
jgi:hypothetical protein